MTLIVNVADVRRLLARSAQPIEVLPGEEYHELHLPGAINVPLKQLSAETARQLDPGHDVVVYCADGL